MKRILFYLLLMLGTIGANAQIITGKVYRAGTDTVIAGASVYYGGSMSGTSTDKNGNFELYAQAQQIPVVVSCIGYYSETATYKPGQPLIVYLKPKITALRTVTIRADGMDRKAEIALFTKEFIGTSTFAKSCTITNIDDIEFFYSKKKRTLTANCDKPIIIENKKLGYTISYFLDSFSGSPANVAFTGNFIFKENIPAKSNPDKIKQNRETAYKNSRMQFIRALWHHQLAQAGFRMYMLNNFSLTEDSITAVDSLNQKYIHLKDKLYILNDLFERSSLTSKEKFSFINKAGFYSQGLQWSGIMAEQRVGDLLPFEYKSANDPPDTIPTKVNPPAPVLTTSAQKTSSLLFEKAYLHTDRDVYAMGDTLWFKAYLVNGQDNKPSVSSGNLYVELIAPDSARIVLREIIRMDNGLGHGDMALDDSLKSGHYTLRAYTNWMRNFGDNFVFEKNITLLDTRAVPVIIDAKAAIKTKKSTAASAAQNKNAAIIPIAAVLPTVHFYPEGGSLVNGIGSFVGVKAEDGYGRGIPATGSVISASGDTVSHFTCDSVGIGLLVMLPMAGQSYHAAVTLGTRQDVFQLPDAVSKGLALQIRQTDTVINAIVSTSDTIVKAKGLLTVKHAGITLLHQFFQLKGKQLSARIATASLPQGICSITLYNEQNKPECERLVYIHHPNNSTLNHKISINTDKKSYQSKERVNLQINAPANSNLSMAVVDAAMVPVKDGDIVSYLNLQSEIRGNIESPNRYFDTTNVNRFRQLDQLLLTQGWRDFVWRRMADTAIRISYAAENGISLPGRVWDEVQNKMLSNLNISLHSDSLKGTRLLFTRTDSAGRFHFDGLMIYGKQRIQLSARDDKGKDKGTFWLDTIRPLSVPSVIQWPAFIANPLDSIAKANTEKKVESMKMANLHGVTKLKEVTIKERSTIMTRSNNMLTTFGYPDQIFNITPNDYKYKTLEWYMLQNVKGATSGLPVGITGVVFFGVDTVKRIPKVVPPNIFINGRELYMDENTQAEAYRIQYFNMPMNKFKKIELRHMVGTLHGVDPITGKFRESTLMVDRFLLYLTMQDNYTLDIPGFLITDIPGYYQARTFYEPPPNAKPSIADYRSTIHWEPDIKTDANGKATVSFYNAVPSTHVRVIAQGITPEGVPLSETSTYEVN
jgi:hypothetical protein